MNNCFLLDIGLLNAMGAVDKKILLEKNNILAEENLKSKSLKVFVEKHKNKNAVRTSMSNYRKEDWLTNIPLYAIGFILSHSESSYIKEIPSHFLNRVSVEVHQKANINACPNCKTILYKVSNFCPSCGFKLM